MTMGHNFSILSYLSVVNENGESRTRAALISLTHVHWIQAAEVSTARPQVFPLWYVCYAEIITGKLFNPGASTENKRRLI